MTDTASSTRTGRCPVVHFDHNSAEHAEDPVASYRRLRNEAPLSVDAVRTARCLAVG